MADNLTGRIIRGYEMLEQIGAGGFGAVYRAAQPILKREVAIKVVLPEYANSPDFIRRFEVEAEVVARLEHPYIIPLFDYWREPDSAYLVMRYLRGGTLQDLLEQGNPLPLDQITIILDQITSALHVSHRNNVIHRDIKPANILLDEDGNAFLTDFGIAKRTDYDNITSTGGSEGITGSISHTPPEQIQNGEITARTDIYAVGVILYQMLTGEHPYKDTTLSQMIFKHLQEPIPEINRADLSYDINDIVEKATAKDPQDRYADARDLSAEFKALIDTGSPKSTLPVDNVLVRTDVENPYKGLRAFQEADADQFFGRDALVSRLLDRMSEPTEDARFLAVIGPSGSGKSSVVKAGLLPAIRNGRLRDSENWFIVEMFPSNAPFQELERALMKIAVNPIPELIRQVEQKNGLSRVINQILPDDNSELVLVIDQFEELFTQVDDEDSRARFLANLVNSVQADNSRLRLIVTMRADFYDKPLQYREFGELLRKRIETVLPMSPSELVQTITRPAQSVGVDFQLGLVEAISQDVGEQAGMLPLLQYTMTELFDNRQSDTLTLAGYQEIGGVAGSLARRSEEIYTGLPFKGQSATRQLFLRLVSLGEGTEDTRRRVRRTELATSDAIDDVIDLYGRYRLLTFDKDPQSREPTVEVAHEALIRTWERLREWIDENREDLRVQRRVSSALSEWLSSGKDKSFLATGARLTQFQEWRDNTDLVLNNNEQNYIQASIDAQNERKAEELRIARRVQNFQRASVILGAMVLIAIVATGILLTQAQSAQRNANIANTEVNQALSVLEPAQTQAFQAQSLADSAETQVALAQTDAEVAEQAVFSAQQQATSAQDDLSTAQFLAGNAQTQAAVSDLLTQQAPTVAAAENRVSELEAQVESVGLTLTPAQLEIESAQSTVIAAQTDVSVAQVEAVIAQNQVATSQADVALAENIISTSEADAAIAQNQVATAQAEVAIAEDGILTSEAEAVIAQNQVATSQAEAENAQNLVATSQVDADNAQTEVSVALIDAQNAQSEANIAQTEVAVAGQTQTPIAQTVVAGAEQLAQQQLNLSTAQALAGNAQTQIAVQEQLTQVAPTLAAADEQVANLQQTLAPAQSTIDAAQSQIDNVDVTLAAIENDVAQSQTQAASVQSAADSIFLAVNAEQALDLGDYDLALALTFESLNLDPTQARARRILNEVAFGTARLSFDQTLVGKISPDGQFFVVSDGNDLVVWDVPTRTVIDRIPAHTASILDVDFSADTTRLATASADATARLWDISGWRNGGSAVETQILSAHTGAINVVRFGLSDRVFTGSEDSNVIEWSVSNGSIVREYTGNTWAIRDLTFVGDGSNFFTTVDANGTPILLYWNVGSINPRFTEDTLIFQQFNDDATRSVLGGRNGQPITIYNTTSRQVTRQFTQGINWGTESATAFDFNPASATALIALSAEQGANRLVEVDVATGAILRTFSSGSSQRIDALAFDPSGGLLLSASDNILTLWDVQSGTVLRTLAAHTDIITDITWSADGRFATSRSRDNNIRLWDVTGADESLHDIYEIQTAINRGKFPGFNVRGDIVTTAAWVSMFSWERQTDMRRETVSTGDEILNIIYSPIDSRAITVLPNVALLWDLDAGTNGRLRTYGDNNSQFTGAAAYSPNGAFIALDEPSRILVYDIATGSRQTINKPRFDDGQQVTSIAVSPDGQYVIASVGVTLQQEAPVGEILMWDTQSGELLYSFPVEHNRNINWLAFSADGNRVLSASDDDTLIIWLVSPEGAQLFRRFAGHSGDVNIGRFVPNSGNTERFIVSASDDRTMILWDIESGQALRTFRGSPAPITGFNISPDGTQMVTTYGLLDPALSRTEPISGSAETLVYVWELTDTDDLIAWTASNRFIRPLTPAECDQFNIANCDAELTIPQSDSSSAPVVPPTTVASNAEAPTQDVTSEPTEPLVSADAPTVTNNGSVNLNVRGSDTTDANVVASLAVGESATILGRSNRDTSWYQIRLDNGQIGWVRNDLVTISGDTTTIAEISPPPVANAPSQPTSNTNQSTPVTSPTEAEVASSNANLQITGLGLIPNPPQCAQAFTVQLNITNTGTEATTADATVFVSDRHVASGSAGPSETATIPPLAPNQNWVVEITLTVTTFFAEEHQLSAQVDSGATIAESNEGDNFFSSNYVLGSGTC